MILQQLVRDACEQSGDVNFRNDYSGRFMYGKRCIAITSNRNDCMLVIAGAITGLREKLMTVQMGSNAEEQYKVFDEGVRTLLDFKEDSMGLDVVLYWPTLGSLDDHEEEILLD
jgi:hypothetical protein